MTVSASSTCIRMESLSSSTSSTVPLSSPCATAETGEWRGRGGRVGESGHYCVNQWTSSVLERDCFLRTTSPLTHLCVAMTAHIRTSIGCVSARPLTQAAKHLSVHSSIATLVIVSNTCTYMQPYIDTLNTHTYCLNTSVGSKVTSFPDNHKHRPVRRGCAGNDSRQQYSEHTLANSTNSYNMQCLPL